MRQGKLFAIGQDFQTDGRTADGKSEAHEYGCFNRYRFADTVQQPVGQTADGKSGHKNLHDPAYQHDFFQSLELLKRKLKPDGKEQQNNAQLGKGSNELLIINGTDTGRSKHNAGKNQTDNGRNSEALKNENNCDCQYTDQHQLAEKIKFVHKKTADSGCPCRSSPPEG